MGWLRRNAETYHNDRWVAVAGGKLIDTDESLAGLRRRLKERPPGPKPLLHQPTPKTPLGFTARVSPAWSGDAMSGANALWGRETMSGMGHRLHQKADEI